MRLILLFFKRQKDFLLFLLLFAFSFSFVLGGNSFQQSKFLYIASDVVGDIYLLRTGVQEYFSLKQQNEQLTKENKELHEQLLRERAQKLEQLSKDPILLYSPEQYAVYRAEVIKNSCHLSKNYLIIDKGLRDSIREDMGVVSPRGIVGIIDKATTRYASVQSVLNTRSKISATHKKSGYYGTLSWDGKDPTIVQLTDIPSLADSIVTAGHSSIFPKGIPIGRVLSVNANTRDNSLLSQVKLFTDMQQLQHVYIIKNKDQVPIQQLEEQIQEQANE